MNHRCLHKPLIPSLLVYHEKCASGDALNTSGSNSNLSSANFWSRPVFVLPYMILAASSSVSPLKLLIHWFQQLKNKVKPLACQEAPSRRIISRLQLKDEPFLPKIVRSSFFLSIFFVSCLFFPFLCLSFFFFLAGKRDFFSVKGDQAIVDPAKRYGNICGGSRQKSVLALRRKVRVISTKPRITFS